METQASASPAAAEPLPPSELSADHQQADDVAERVPDASSSPAPPSRPLEASAQKPQQQVAPQSPPQPLQSPRPEASQTSEQTSQQASQQPSQQPSEQPPQQPSQQPPQQPSQQPLPGPNSSSTVQQRPRIPPRDRYNLQSLGPSLNSAVKQARVLMVGAGGIGCELLKNLVLTGFGQIHIVDLDTIDLSNLNRQFLFRREHIKKPKAFVARDAAHIFNPNVEIVAHNADIKEARFNAAWFRGFDLVFNALDNLEARRHVNKMCLAVDVPLIESGTTGFNGQVQVIKKGLSACYDCTPKETPKTFPVCTIRSTPSQPIHCIVWAKSHLLNEVFGVSEDVSAFDYSDSANAQEMEELKRESEKLREIRTAIGTQGFAQLLFDKVFNQDIERLRSVEDLWKSRRRPEPLDYEMLLSQIQKESISASQVSSEGQRVWSLQESLAVFNDSLDRLAKRTTKLKESAASSGHAPTITFDKDDADTLDFVVSSANIRATIFGIDRKSLFDVKQMAGNIVPAIATTNAIVAGLCVLESFKVLRGDYAQSKEVFLTPFAPARLLAADQSREPNPECVVCGVFNTGISVDMSRATLGDVVEGIIKDKLGYENREFAVNNEVGVLYDADETENLSKRLAELGVGENSFLTVIDESEEDALVNVVICIQEQEGESKENEMSVVANFTHRPEIPRRRKREATPAAASGDLNGGATANTASDSEQKGIKRSHPDDPGHPMKKSKTTNSDADDVVLVDDTGGAIIIKDD